MQPIGPPGSDQWASGTGFVFAALALTSVAALLEVPVSLMARPGWRRPGAALVATTAAFLLALPSALAYSTLRHLLSVPLLERVDQVSSDIVLPLSGIAVALFAGWVWPATDAMRASGLPPPPLGRLWLWLLRLMIPTTIALVLLGGLAAIWEGQSTKRAS